MDTPKSKRKEGKKKKPSTPPATDFEVSTPPKGALVNGFHLKSPEDEASGIGLAVAVGKSSVFLPWLTSAEGILMRVCELSSIHSPTVIDHLILLSRYMQCVNNGSVPILANQVVEGLFDVLITTLHASPSLDPVDLRGESLPIYLLKTFMIQFGTETRIAVIDPVTRRFYDSDDRLASLSFAAIAKEKVSQQDLKLLKRLLKELKFLVEEMVHRSRAFMLFPPPILYLCYHVYDSLVQFHAPSSSSPPCPNSEEGKKCHASAIDDLSSFIFLRYVCPSLVNLYSSENRIPPPSVSSLAARILMHITGQLEGGWTKSQSLKVKKEIDTLIDSTRPKLRMFGEAVIENASRFYTRNVKELIEEEILVLPEDDYENFSSVLEKSLGEIVTKMTESSGFQEFHTPISSISKALQSDPSVGDIASSEAFFESNEAKKKIQLKSRQRTSRMSFCGGAASDRVSPINPEYFFMDLQEDSDEEEKNEGGEIGKEEGKKKDCEEGKEADFSRKKSYPSGDKQPEGLAKKTFHHEKRSWSTSSVDLPVINGTIGLKKNRSSGGPRPDMDDIDLSVGWESPRPASNCAVIGRENLDLLSWSSKAWNRRAEGRESYRWGKKESRTITQKTQLLVTKELGPQPLNLASQDSCPGVYGAMWCCVREIMVVGNVPRSVKEFVGSVVGKAVAFPFLGESIDGSSDGEEEGDQAKQQLTGNEIEVEVDVGGGTLEQISLSLSGMEELSTLFVNQHHQMIPRFTKIKSSPRSPLRSPSRSNSSSYFSLGRGSQSLPPAAKQASGPSSPSSSVPPSPRGKSFPPSHLSEPSRLKANSSPPLKASPLSTPPPPTDIPSVDSLSASTPPSTPPPSSSSPSSISGSSSSFSSSSSNTSLNSGSRTLLAVDAESELTSSPKKSSKKEKKEVLGPQSPVRKFRAHRKQKVSVANAQLSLASLLLWSKAVTRGRSEKGFPAIIHSPPYPPSLEPELLGAVVLNAYLCRTSCLNLCGQRAERPLAKLSVSKQQKRKVPGESLEMFSGLSCGFEEDFAEGGYSWDEEPLILAWARGSSRISRAFCRLLLESRREVDSFLSAAVVEFVEMRLHEFNGTISNALYDTEDWIEEEMRKFTQHSKSKDPFDLLCCQIALRTAFCPHLFQKKEKRGLRKKFKDRQWVGLVAWSSVLVSCRLACLAIQTRDEPSPP